MKSLQAQYKSEREKIETFETEEYFFTFKMIEREFHVFDVYILPEFRSSETSDKLQEKIHDLANEYAANMIVGFIYKNVQGNERSLVYQLKHGMKLHSWDAEKIVLYKGLD